MPPLETLGTFIFASALLSLAPGPDNLFVLTQSALHGRRTGILITLGLCSGLVVHTTAVALGLAVILQTSTIAFTLLKGTGAAYLLYLAWQAFQAASLDQTTSNTVPSSAGALYLRGIVMNLSNPKVSLFFLAFLPQFASAEAGPITPQLFLLGGVFIATGLTIFILIAILADTLGAWLNHSPKAQPLLNRIAGTVFAGLALKLVLSPMEK